ncbi:TPA: 50S ribosomal protein L10 [Patescibacteria group bacterium]|nr:50S ribosomal protein L10 [Patescibacteria group bacterium]
MVRLGERRFFNFKEKKVPKTRMQKTAQLTKLVDKLQSSKAVVLTEFTGLTMENLDSLRAKARKEGVSFQVAKNTLLDKAAKEAGIEGLITQKAGKQIAIATDGNDEVAISKLIYQFAKDNSEKIKIFAGILEKKMVSVDVINQLAQLPNREELLSKLVGSMSAPISGFIRVLNGPTQSFYNVVKALSTK